MPFIEKSAYKAPLFFSNAHYQTIYQSEFRRVDGVDYTRERIDTPDGDFIDVDWVRSNSDSLTILVHGLESGTKRPYMKGMVRALAKRGFDCAAMNLRSCSGEVPRTAVLYNAGKTDDLELLINKAFLMGYTKVSLLGFSLGGNIVLKYVGDKGKSIDRRIQKAAAVSVPCDLRSSTERLERFSNIVYNRRFVKKLKRKIRMVMAVAPESVSDDRFHLVKTMRDYDDNYTAPMFGFRNANDYYAKASSLNVLEKIAISTLIINAKDDPFLGEGCFPVSAARNNAFLFLEIPSRGGHVGFLTAKSEYYHEKRISDFFAE